MGTALFQLHHREGFERGVTLALAAGAFAGALQLLSARFFVAPPWPLLAFVGVGLSAVRGNGRERLVLAGLALLPALAWSFGMSPGWTVAVAGAGVGLVMVRAHHVAGAVLGAALGPVGLFVSHVLARHLSDLATPALFVSAIEGAVVSLFLSLAQVAGHLALRPDPVEARCEALLPTLAGEFHALASRALSLYRRCGEAMGGLPANPAREELARTLAQLTRGAVELASEWSGVESELEERTRGELEAEIGSLRESAAACRDELARRRLELAAESLSDELSRVDDLVVRRERILARIKAEVALLERARVALLGLRSGQVQIRAVELTALARRFSSLSRIQSDEALAAHEAAAGAERAQQDAEIAERADRVRA